MLVGKPVFCNWVSTKRGETPQAPFLTLHAVTPYIVCTSMHVVQFFCTVLIKTPISPAQAGFDPEAGREHGSARIRRISTDEGLSGVARAGGLRRGELKENTDGHGCDGWARMFEFEIMSESTAKRLGHRSGAVFAEEDSLARHAHVCFAMHPSCFVFGILCALGVLAVHFCSDVMSGIACAGGLRLG